MWIIQICASFTQNTVFTKADVTQWDFEEVYDTCGGVQNLFELSGKANRFHGINFLGNIYISFLTYKN